MKQFARAWPFRRSSSERGRVTVTANGTDFVADACICTVPARTLDKIVFDPPLPAVQKDAAEKLQYARIIKNSMLFRERFWGPENFSLVSDVTSHYYFHSTKDQPGKQGILCSYAVGEKADVLASQNNTRRTEVITTDLVPLEKRAPNLALDIQSSHGSEDKYTQGAYAFFRPGQWFTLRPISPGHTVKSCLRESIWPSGRVSWKAQSLRVKRPLRH